jgi:hypothetical protein
MNSAVSHSSFPRTSAGPTRRRSDRRAFRGRRRRLRQCGVYLDGPVSATDVEAIHQTVDVNIHGALTLARSPLPPARSSGGRHHLHELGIGPSGYRVRADLHGD